MKIGIDIGGSHIGISMIGLGGQIRARAEKDLQPGKKEKATLENDILQTIETLVKDNEIAQSAITRIGVAIPGIIEGNTAKQLWNLHIEEWNMEFLQKAYPKAIVTLRNDADAAALAEKQYGALKNYENAVFLCLGTGIGGGYIQDGKLAFANQFEPGHMTIQKDGKRCACGNKGCFETYASMKQFKQNMIHVLGLEPTTSSKEIVEIIKTMEDNSLVKQVIEAYVENLAIGIGNLCNIVTPQAVCLGGSFVYYQTWFLPLLEKTLQEKDYIFHKKNIPVVVTAALGNDAGMLGAVL